MLAVQVIASLGLLVGAQLTTPYRCAQEGIKIRTELRLSTSEARNSS